MGGVRGSRSFVQVVVLPSPFFQAGSLKDIVLPIKSRWARGEGEILRWYVSDLALAIGVINIVRRLYRVFPRY